MKSKTLVITFLSVTAFAVGCNQEPTASQQIDKAKTETADAARDMKDYTFTQKTEFVTKMQGQLDALNKDLDQLSAKIESSSDTIKTEAKPKLQALRDQSAELTKQLDNGPERHRVHLGQRESHFPKSLRFSEGQVSASSPMAERQNPAVKRRGSE